MKTEPADIKVEAEEETPHDVKEMEEERDVLEDKKDLDFLFKGIECLAAMESQNEHPPFNTEKQEMDAKVSAAWRILEETSYLSDPEYNASPLPQEVNREQEQESHPNDISPVEVSSPDGALGNPGPSSTPDMARELPNASSSSEGQQFLCSLCGKASRSLHQFVEHKRSHEKKKSFKCNICSKEFFSKSTLERHMRNHAFAKQNLFSVSELEAKVDQASQPSGKSTTKGKSSKNLVKKLDIRFYMEEAKKGEYVVFRTPSESTRRLGNKKRITKQGRSFVCNFCNKTCTTKGGLVIHLRTHTGEKPFKCEVCSRRFIHSQQLKEHIHTHTGEKPFTCPVCQKSFSFQTNLSRHSRVHTGKKPFKCNVCNERFSRRSHLKAHSYIHSGEPPLVCTFCSKAFKDSSGLRKHIRTHTGERPFECNICNKRYSRSGHLKKHSFIHSDETPFACSVCGKGFKFKRTLKLHTRTHLGKRPFKCNTCDKEFSHKAHFNTHCRIHTGERPFCCDICEKRFNRKDNLANHIKRLHV